MESGVVASRDWLAACSARPPFGPWGLGLIVGQAGPLWLGWELDRELDWELDWELKPVLATGPCGPGIK